MSAPVIECVGATKRFGEALAVDNVSFSLEPGEILSVLGPSGCGKTTLLRLLAGFERLEEGEVRIQGRVASTPLAHLSPDRRKVGMVFQEYALFPHLTVAKNVMFGLSKLPGPEQRERMAQVLDLVSLKGLEERYPHELSGGEQQRVALARTLAPSPVVLLLDEPFNNLDTAMRAEMRREVEGILRENQVTTIFVTHDREEAFATADRVAVMREGRLEQIEAPDVLYHSPATKFVARLTGVCDFLVGEVGDGGVVTELGELPWVTNGEHYPNGTQVELLVHVNDFHVRAEPPGKSEVVLREFRGDEIILTVRTPSGAHLRCRQDPFYTLPLGTTVVLSPARSTPFLAFTRSEDE